MKLALVYDQRSPISRAWREGLLETASADVAWPPSAPGAVADVEADGASRERAGAASFRRLARAIPHSGGRDLATRSLHLAQLPIAVAKLRATVRRVRPDLVHGLRIPFEGIACALALRREAVPLIVSVWGNDFTLHARESSIVLRLTKYVLRRADGLHSDCERDQVLARALGWDAGRPSLVVPGSGGVDSKVFSTATGKPREPAFVARLGAGPWILNPRGIRAYVETEAFLKAVPSILAKFPSAAVVMPGTEGHAEAERLRRNCATPEAVHLLPALRPAEMAELFRSSAVFVSPSRHDGTPNTLLEGMACGSYPIVGDVVSVREWIRDGENGSVLRDLRPETIAEGVIRALSREDERRSAAILNVKIVEERAERKACMRRVKEFYEAVAERKRGTRQG